MIHKPRQRVSFGESIPAPTGGLNALNSLPSMPATDAITLRNIIPTPYGCTVRKGWQNHVTSVTGQCNTLMSWNASTGANKLFGVSTDGIWDVTTAHEQIPPEVAVAPSTNSWWQHTQLTNAAGTHLIAFNGTDDGFLYNGTGYHALVLGDGVVAYTWKNIDPKSLVQCAVHQRRLWAVEKNSTNGWYLPPEQIYGIATKFDFGSNFPQGGYLQAICTWSLDTGDGMDDKLLAISSNGDVCVYQGIDPNDPDNWSLEGVYRIGGTFSRRCWTKFGGDVVFLTQWGIVTASSMLNQTETVSANRMSHKIQNLISDLVVEGELRAGWQILSYPVQDMLLINVPASTNVGDNVQLLMNTITGGWCTLSGVPASCWHPFGSGLYFGTLGAVCRGFEGRRDDVPIEPDDENFGNEINAEAQQAFFYFASTKAASAGQNKHFKFIRPAFVFDGEFRYRMTAKMAFELGGAFDTPSSNIRRTGIWDVSKWDDGAKWYGGAQSDKNWIFANGISYAASARLVINCSCEVTWISTDWIFEAGGLI